MTRFGFVLFSLAAFSAACAPNTNAQSAQPAEIAVTAAPLDDAPASAAGRRFGALNLVWAGELTAQDARFGGASALEVADFTREHPHIDTQELVLVTDAAHVFELKLRPSDLSAGEAKTVRAAVRPLLDEDGAPLTGKRDGDSEGLAMGWGEEACNLVSFERRHRIGVFCALPEDAGATAPWRAAAQAPLESHEGVLANNNGLEALALLGDGLVLAGGETPTLNGSHPVWAMRPAAANDAEDAAWAPITDAPAFGVASPGPGYGLTGMDAGPNDTVLVLFRRWVPGVGNSAVIAYMSGRDIAAALAQGPGEGDFTHPVVTPRELARFTHDGPLPMDNFEGVAVSRASNGRTLIWIISDDNFRSQQRTLLFAFEWAQR